MKLQKLILSSLLIFSISFLTNTLNAQHRLPGDNENKDIPQAKAGNKQSNETYQSEHHNDAVGKPAPSKDNLREKDNPATKTKMSQMNKRLRKAERNLRKAKRRRTMSRSQLRKKEAQLSKAKETLRDLEKTFEQLEKDMDQIDKDIDTPDKPANHNNRGRRRPRN